MPRDLLEEQNEPRDLLADYQPPVDNNELSFRQGVEPDFIDKVFSFFRDPQKEKARATLALVDSEALGINPHTAYNAKKAIDKYYDIDPTRKKAKEDKLTRIRAFNDMGGEEEEWHTLFLRNAQKLPYHMMDAAGNWIRMFEESPEAAFAMTGATPSEEDLQTFRIATEAIEKKKVRTLGQDISEGAKEDIKRLTPATAPDSWKDTVHMAGDSVTTNLVWLIPGFKYGKAASLMGMGWQATGQIYGEQREGGSDPGTAFGASVIGGMSEVLSEFIPVGIYLKPKASFIRSLVAAEFSEIPTEMANQVVQDVVDKATIRPDMTIEDMIDNLSQTIQVTALSTLALSGMSYSANKAIGKATQRTEHADTFNQAKNKALRDGKTPQEAVKDGLDAVRSTPEGNAFIDQKEAEIRQAAKDYKPTENKTPFIIGVNDENGEVTSFTMADPISGQTFDVPAIDKSGDKEGATVKFIPDPKVINEALSRIREPEEIDAKIDKLIEGDEDIDKVVNQIFGEDVPDFESEEDTTTPEKTEPAANVDPLITEARKYKTAEEFVKADRSNVTKMETVNPETLTFREEQQHRTENVREMFDPEDMPPITVIDDGTIIDGHNRAIIAKEEGIDINTISIPKEIYDKLKEKGFDDIEISYAMLRDQMEVGFADNLDKQFPGANVQKEGFKALDIIEEERKADLTSIWNKAQEGKGEINESDKNLPQDAISPSIQRIKEKVSMKDFRNIIERYFPQVKDYYADEGIKTVDDYLEKMDTDTIDMEISSNQTPNDAIRKLLGGDEFAWDEVNFSDIIDMYKRKELVPVIDRKPFRIGDQQIEDVPVKGTKNFYETTNAKQSENVQDVYNKATQRITGNNKAEVNKNRKKLFLLWATDAELHKKLNISKAELNKKIKTYTGANISDVAVQNRVNEGIPNQFHWTGVTNSNYINKTDISLDDVDSVVAKIDDNTQNRRFGSPDGTSLRRYIMNTLLAIDTRLKYDDLNFIINHLEKALGEYSNKNLTITISSGSQNTVAHEIGHYLDYRFAREMGLDLRGLSDGGYNFEYIKEKHNLSDEHIKWAKEFIAFIDNLRTKGEIGHTADRADYLQRPTEVFARFIAKFVDWTSEKSGFKHHELNYYSDRFDTNDYYNFIKLLQKKAELDSKYNIKPIVKGAGEDINASYSNKDAVNADPMFEIAKYIKERGGLNYDSLIVDWGKEDVGILMKKRPGVVRKDGALKLDEVAQEWDTNDNDLMMDLLSNKSKKEVISQVSMKSEEEYLKTLYDNEQVSRAEFTRAVNKARIAFQEGNAAELKRLKNSIKWMAKRKETLKNVRDYFGLTDTEMSKISRKNPLLMDEAEFAQYLKDVNLKAIDLRDNKWAKIELMNLVEQKRLQKVDNYRRALELPSIDKMTTDQLRQFAKLLEPFQNDDIFLTQRELETVDKTDLKGIKTWREARERLAKEAGVPIEELAKVKVAWNENFKWDSSLREQDPFFDLLVTKMTESMMGAEMKVHNVESKIYDLAKKAEKSRKRGIVERMIPQDELIFQYLEAPQAEKNAVAQQMTPEQLRLAHFMNQYFSNALNYLIAIKSVEHGRQNYITHIRKSFMENVRDKGIKEAITGLFTAYQEDQMGFNILDDDTGNILPLEKFFQYSLHRTGELEPTKNVVRAFMTYVSTFEKKKAFDAIIPKLDIYTQSLTPVKYTPRGLEFDRSLKTFVNKWINNKKGRKISYDSAIRQGGVLDLGIRALRTITTMIDLGFYVPAQIINFMGEQLTTVVPLGYKDYAKSIGLMRTDKGKRILKKYEFFTERSLWEEFTAPGKEIQQRLMDGMFGLFHISTVAANKQFLLASMTKEEWANEELSPERLAKIKLDMGRFRAIPGANSLVGSTSLGGSAMQYKAWAVGPTRTLIKDITTMAGKLKKKQYGEAFTSDEARELYRIVGTTIAVVAVTSLAGDDDDDSFIGKMKKRATREVFTLTQGMDPTFWLSWRSLSYLTQLGTALKNLLFLEEYETKEGLKGVNQLKKAVTPGMIRALPDEEE